jgi:hypothetical protein
MQLPKAPFYRRWSVLLAGVIGLAAIVALLGWRGLQQVDEPAPTTTAPTTTVVTSTTTTPATSVEPTSRPADVLWEMEGSDVVRSPGFAAPAAWRIVWEYDCTGWGAGGGNFKITGDGAFDLVDIQATNVRASGRRPFTRAGYGHLLVESVCDHWKVTVLAG